MRPLYQNKQLLYLGIYFHYYVIPDERETGERGGCSESERVSAVLFKGTGNTNWLSFLSAHLIAYASPHPSLTSPALLSSGIINNVETNVSNNIQRYFDCCFYFVARVERLNNVSDTSIVASGYRPPWNCFMKNFTHERNAICHDHVRVNEFILHHVRINVLFV